jgi:alpha-glucosidase
MYQIYPRSFADGNGDDTGDLIGIRERLDHLVDLGVDGVWISPFYRSPMADGGYDVADPCDVDPLFGTLADFDEMLAAAHQRGLKVTIDLVPNHFSVEHRWFQAVLHGGPDAPERDLFVIRAGRGPDGAQPPNNWPSVFGGPAWSQLPDGAWYLHLFAPEQPDLNWANPAVPAEFERIERFWLDRGVDGFRVDVGHSLAKEPGLPDMDLSVLEHVDGLVPMRSIRDIRWDREEVHTYHRGMRRVLDSYPGDRMAVGEVWVADGERLARYVRPDELNLTFNFGLAEAGWAAGDFRKAIEDSLDAMGAVTAPCTWVLANHDIDRIATRYGGGDLGVRRARAAALVQLSQPGAAGLYNGDEQGLQNVELPTDALDDPQWEHSGHTQRGRDGERVPLPWSGTAPPYGFTTAARTWLPMPEDWAPVTVAAQAVDPASTLSLYKTTLRLRRTLPELQTADIELLDAPLDCLVYRRGGLTVWLNAGGDPVPMPAGELVHASGPVGAELPPDTTVWVRS